MKLNPWFQEFLLDTNNKKVQNYTSLISLRDSISDGINHLPVSELYRRMSNISINSTNLLNGYTQSSGHPLLVFGLKYYERLIAGMQESDNDFAEYIRITVGASSAIQIVISYYSNIINNNGKVILCGMSYYLFQKSCRLNNLDLEVVYSDNGLLPQVEDICKAIKLSPRACIVLTHPANPSGEMYSPSDLELILDTCKEAQSIVIFDLCQYDEMIMEDNILTPEKIIRKTCTQMNVVIINSFSKTRAIAGARIGYVVTQNLQLANYIEWCNEMLYFNHPLGNECAIIIDLFYRIILRVSETDRKKVIRSFRNIILQTAGIHIYKNIFSPILHSNSVLQDGLNFRNDILEKNMIIMDNYQFCKKELELRKHFKLSVLKGGYNFCVQIPIPISYDENCCIQQLSALMGTGVLSQQSFCVPANRNATRLWIRISAAMEQSRFREYILKLKDWE